MFKGKGSYLLTVAKSNFVLVCVVDACSTSSFGQGINHTVNVLFTSSVFYDFAFPFDWFMFRPLFCL